MSDIKSDPSHERFKKIFHMKPEQADFKFLHREDHDAIASVI